MEGRDGAGGNAPEIGPVDTTEQRLQFYESLLQAHSELGEGIATLELTTQKLTWVNDAFCEMVGRDRRELLSLPSFFALVTAAEVPRLLEELQGVLDGTRRVDFVETTLVHSSGRRVAIEVATRPLGPADSTAMLALVRDVTARQSALEEQRRAQERYRAIVENSMFGVFQTSVDGRVLSANQAAADIAGFASASELMAAVPNIRDLYADPRQRDRFVEEMSETGSVRDFRYRLTRKDGDIIWVSVTGRALRSENGDVYAFEGMIADVTEEQLTRSAAQVFSSELDPKRALHAFADVVQEILPFGQVTLTVIEGDVCRRVVSVGDYSSALPEGLSIPLQGNPQEVVVRTKQPLVVDELPQRFVIDEDLVNMGLHSYVILPLLDENGVFATVNVSFIAPHVPLNTVRLLSSIAVSIAQGVKNVLAFEDRAKAIQRLRELDQMKNDLVAMVAHDLRSPLAAMMGFAETMVRQYDALDDDIKKELLDRIAKNSKQLSRLIEDLLAAAAIESGTFTIATEPFDILDVVQRVRSENLSTDDAARVRVKCNPPLPLALGDKQRTWQVIANLVTNALKFSPAGAPVDIKLTPTGGVITVEVTDSGIGVAATEITRIFDKYARSKDPEAKGVEGIGLGLHTCKLLVEAQGGTIGAESEPGVGSTFRFTIPAVA